MHSAHAENNQKKSPGSISKENLPQLNTQSIEYHSYKYAMPQCHNDTQSFHLLKLFHNVHLAWLALKIVFPSNQRLFPLWGEMGSNHKRSEPNIVNW